MDNGVGKILLVLLLAPAPLWAQEPQWTPEQREIAEVIERTEAANNAGDVDSWMALFAADAVYMPPGVPAVTTREGLREMATAGFRNRADIAIEPAEIVVTGPWAWARNRVTGTVTVASTADVVNVDVKQIVIYRRTEDGWRIVQLISNRNGTG